MSKEKDIYQAFPSHRSPLYNMPSSDGRERYIVSAWGPHTKIYTLLAEMCFSGSSSRIPAHGEKEAMGWNGREGHQGLGSPHRIAWSVNTGYA